MAVRLLDAGLWLESERAELVGQMRQQAPNAWTPEQLARLKEGTSAGAAGVPLKLVFGSDFPYRECEQHVPADFDGVALRATLARGGFSNVWGAAMMPCLDRDLVGWPVQVAQLARHYAAVLQFTGLSAKHDGLEPFFPLYGAQDPALEPSRQAQALLQRLQRHQARLARAGIHFGQARLSVQAAPKANPAAASIADFACMAAHTGISTIPPIRCSGCKPGPVSAMNRTGSSPGSASRGTKS